jgi:hypothetical protein
VHKVKVAARRFDTDKGVWETKEFVIRADNADGRGAFAPRWCGSGGDGAPVVWARRGDIISVYGGDVVVRAGRRHQLGPAEGTHYITIPCGGGIVIDGLLWTLEKQVRLVCLSLYFGVCACACY